MTPEAIAVVIPAHNEEALLPPALAAVTAAAGHPALADLRVMTVVAADACVDETAKVADTAGASVLLRTPDCPVETSSRLRPRAVGGFGDHLAQLAAEEGAMH
ncbi:hypothetical protein [Streptomyces nigrescens]|uniref:hypothetical protein n=1 Tax=Streptomyces nigrescens TaxID=1920 RepID=UPI003484153C